MVYTSFDVTKPTEQPAEPRVARAPSTTSPDAAAPSPSVVVETPARTPPEGRRFRYHETLAGKYRLEKSLARGGMGWVFLATQLPLERKVAVKVLRPGNADKAFRERFLLEASTCAKLQHPHIVTIHDYGETEQGDLFMAMEFLDGPSLSSVLGKAGRLSVERALRIIMQVARALRAAHKSGVVHRDLKPSNIMLLSHDEDETRDFVKVVDFGLAKLFQGDGTGGAIELTRAGTLLGSPRYMAPEQIRNRAVDPRTDIYSLGVILFYVLTGKPPFNSDNATDILAQHLRDPVPSLSEAAGELEIPIEVERIVHRCMAKQPERRYPSINELARDLKVAYEGYLEGSLPSDSFDEAGATVSAPLIADLSDSALSTPPPLPNEQASGVLREPALVDPSVAVSAPSMAAPAPGPTPVAPAAVPVEDLPPPAPTAHPAPPPAEPRRRRGVWLALALLLLLAGVAWWGLRGPGPEPVAVAPNGPSPSGDPGGPSGSNAAPAPAARLTVRTDPPGLVLLDDAGAELGKSPLVVPMPTPAHPLRVRARRGEASSALMRVLPEPGADAVTLDLRAWATRLEATPDPVDEAAASAPRRAEDDRRPARRRGGEPRRRARAEPEPAPEPEPAREPEPAAEPDPTPAIAAEPSAPAVSTVEEARPTVGIIDDKQPRIDLVDDEADPDIGLVDEREAPSVGIIEE